MHIEEWDALPADWPLAPTPGWIPPPPPLNMLVEWCEECGNFIPCEPWDHYPTCSRWAPPPPEWSRLFEDDPRDFPDDGLP
jgi:hypothetical protein